MDIHWDSIETLKNKRIDLWILVPSGMVINRLLDRKGNIICSQKLESYFGLQIEEIKNIFYEKQEVETLFEQKETIQKINKPIEKIAEIYINRLKNIFKFVTEKPLVLLNSKNVPIYHFIFASNNNTAFKIASYIIEKRQK
jgi:three-Cys-motif partner protein